LEHFADRILEAVRAKRTPLVVGLDPRLDQLPKPLFERISASSDPLSASAQAFEDFSKGVIEAIADCAAAVKPQSAFFEMLGARGVEAFEKTCDFARSRGLLVIGDVKRGDIGSTAEAYASAHLRNSEFVEMENIVAPDAITINGFAGLDGIIPFADAAQEQGKGVFVWVRASNPSAAVLQDFADAQGKRFFELLAEQVALVACEPKRIGKCGLSNVGMVVGGTAAPQARSLRQKFPQIIFLVPGYGAQGAAAADCLQFCKDNGSGALVTASRSIIYAYDNPRYKEQFGDNWEKCIEQACQDMKAELAAAWANR